MIEPIAKLDSSIESQLWLALVDIVKSDRTLRRFVRTWQTFEDGTDSIDPPTQSEMPWIRMLPGPSTMEIIEEGRYRITMDIYVTIATAGLKPSHSLNLWAAFRMALAHGKAYMGTDVAEYLRELGCEFCQISSPGIGFSPQPSASAVAKTINVVSAARIQVKFRVAL